MLETRRNLDETLRPEHSDRVQVGRRSSQAKPLCLKRYRASSSKRIKEGGDTSRIGPPNLISRLSQQRFIVRVFPAHKFGKESVKAHALLILGFLGWILVRVR